MAPQEKSRESRARWTHFYHQLIKRYRDAYAINKTRIPEACIPYLIHILSSDPDLQQHGLNKDGLARARGCLQFMLEPLLQKSYPESFGFVKRMTELLKQTKMTDHQNDESKNEIMYAICDLAMQYVLQKSAQNAVAVIEPADKALIRLIPESHFTKLSGEENENYYLPEEFRISARNFPVPNATNGKYKRTSNKKDSNTKKTILARKVVAVSKVAVGTPVVTKSLRNHRVSVTPKPVSSSTPSVSSIDSPSPTKSSSISTSVSGDDPKLSSWLKTARPKPSSPGVRSQPNSRLPPRKRKLNLENSQDKSSTSSIPFSSSSDEENDEPTTQDNSSEKFESRLNDTDSLKSSSALENSPIRPRRRNAGQNRKYDEYVSTSPAKRKLAAVDSPSPKKAFRGKTKNLENESQKKPKKKVTPTSKKVKVVVSKPLTETDSDNNKDLQSSASTRRSVRQRTKKN